ncbi:MAG TPA: hypothetical protein PLB89_11060 [Flavobacteriales bacterium]|nr:hypothetical protein [Flavobacteriales bacterium]
MAEHFADMDIESNNRFKKVTELDEGVFKVIEQPLVDLIKKSREWPQKQTMLLCAQFIGTTNFLKEGIFELTTTDNPIAVRVLFRSLIEHYLRFTYIFMRALSEGNDHAATDYLHVLDAREMVDYAKALIFSGGLERGPTGDKNAWSVLDDERMNRNNVSRQETDRVTKLFQIREILNYITKTLASDGKGVPPMLRSIIPEYSLLSSNVHGGPKSLWEMLEEGDVDQRHAALFKYCELAFLMAASVKEFTFMLAAKHETGLIRVAQKIAEYRGQLIQ